MRFRLPAYLFWKRARRPRAVISFTMRRPDWPKFWGGGSLAAASSRSAWVLIDGCPVLSVHFSFVLARHLGQGTDKIRFNVSFSGCTPLLFSINNCSDGQFCSFRLQCPKLKTKVGQDQFVTPQK